MLNQFSRTQLLFGPEAMERLAKSRVAVFGIGGVGGYAVEALVRSGIGALDLIDDDRVCLTNLNRQLYATRKTVGKYKVDVAAERILEINPDCSVTVHKTFYLPDTQAMFDFSRYDYVVDAIDTVTGKLALVEQAQASGTPIISAMGAGNKLDPAVFIDIPENRLSWEMSFAAMRDGYRAQGYSRINCFCSFRCRPDHCRRSCKRPLRSFLIRIAKNLPRVTAPEILF